MIELGGTIHPAIYLRAMRWRRGSLAWLPLVFIVIGVIGLTSPRGEWSLYLFLLSFGVLIFVLRPLLARRQVRTNKFLHDLRSGTADETGITTTTPRGTAKFAWSDYHRASVGPDFVLLYLSSSMYQVVPRSFFSGDAAWNEFHALVQSHVRPARAIRRGWWWCGSRRSPGRALLGAHEALSSALATPSTTCAIAA